LFLLSIITFLTFINGFQLGNKLKITDLTNYQTEQKKTLTEIKHLEKEKINLTGLTLEQIENTFSRKREELKKQNEDEIEAIELTMEKEKARLGGAKATLLRKEIDDFKNKAKVLNDLHGSNIERIEKTYEQQISAISIDTKTKKDELAKLIDDQKQVIKGLSLKIEKKEKKINSLRTKTSINSNDETLIRNRANKDRGNVKQTIESDKLALKERATEVEKMLQSAITKKNNNFFGDTSLNNKIKNLESKLETLSKNRMNLNIKTQLQEINDKEKRDILATRNQLKVEKDQQVNDLKKEISEINEDLLNQKKQRDNLIQKSSVTTQGNKRVALLNTKTSEAKKTSSSYMEDEKILSKQIMEKETDLANFLGIYEEQLSPMENDKAMQINTIRERTRQAIQTEEDIKNKNINDFNGREYRIGEISERILDLKKSVDVDEAKIMEEGRNTLVGSWTIFFFKNMEPDNLRLVTMIWYGSLAAITAWTGTLLAFASLVLRYSHEKKNDPSRLMRSIQKYFIYARKNKRKPRIKEVEKEVEKIVEVIKEVPVTKVVTQEVPKEVIRKQIIHVPVATDDLTILDFNDRRSNKSEKDNPNTANEGTSNSKT